MCPLINWGPCPQCDNLESEHKVVEQEWPPPQKSLVMAIGCPPELAQAQSPAPWVESDMIGR